MNTDLINIFLESFVAEHGVSKNTLKAYETDILQFNDYVKNEDVKNISENNIKEFIHFLNLKEYSSKSISRKISALRDFFKFLLSENFIHINPAINLDLPKKEKNIPDFLSQEDIWRMIDFAQSSENFVFRRDAVIIMMMYACGLRISEVLSLNIPSINFNKALVFVKGKGNKERFVPIAQNALDILKKYIKERECFLKNKQSNFLFFSVKNISKPLTRDVFFKQLQSIALFSGISKEKAHPHILRHSFATFLINHDIGLRSVQKMLGHENICTTEIYTHIVSDNLKNTIKNKHPLAKLSKKL